MCIRLKILIFKIMNTIVDNKLKLNKKVNSSEIYKKLWIFVSSGWHFLNDITPIYNLKM